MITSLLVAALLSAPGITIAWDPVLVDRNGGPETVTRYEVLVFDDVTRALVYSNDIPADSTQVTIASPAFGSGRWRIEVRAIDAARNRSDPGVFIYTPPADAVPPMKPENLRVGESL